MASSRSVVRCRPPRGDAGARGCTTDPDVLAAFVSDAAHVPGGFTRAVCVPESEAAVAALLADGGPVLVAGARSSLTGGATPRGETVLATTRLAAIGPVAADRVAVGPGVVLADLRRALAARNRWFPPTPTYDGATVGGAIATNAAGAATFRYGATRAWVRALTVVLPDAGVLEIERGEATASPDGRFDVIGLDGRPRPVPVPAYRMPTVRKLAAGYYAAPGMDLVDLFVGAEGTLGVVTEAVLDVEGPEPAWLVALTPCADEAAALRLADALRGAARDARGADRIEVVAIEYLDARSLALVRADGVPAALGLGLADDAATAVLFQVALPSGTTADAAAAALARADDPTSDTMLGRLCRLLARHGLLAATLPALPGETRRRDALCALREAVPEAVNRRVAAAQRTIDPTLAKSGGDAIVPVDRIAALLAESRAILAAADLDHAVWGHLSDGNLHPNVLPRRPEDGPRAAAAQLAIGAAAIALGGSPLSEHGVGRSPVKQALLERLYGADGIRQMRRLKQALDPRGVLAPGVLFAPGSV